MTVTPGTAEPCASTNRPVMFPVVCCASSGTGSTQHDQHHRDDDSLHLSSSLRITMTCWRVPRRAKGATTAPAELGRSARRKSTERKVLGTARGWDELRRQREIQRLGGGPIGFWIVTNGVTKCVVKHWLRGTNVICHFRGRLHAVARPRDAAARPLAAVAAARPLLAPRPVSDPPAGAPARD